MIRFVAACSARFSVAAGRKHPSFWGIQDPPCYSVDAQWWRLLENPSKSEEIGLPDQAAVLPAQHMNAKSQHNASD